MSYEWSELNEIFNEGLEISPSDRSNFVKRRCDGNRELELTVLNMLQASEKADNYFSELHCKIAEGINRKSESILFEKGDIIGKYQIVSLLDRGGMGEIYLAQRNDGQFQQKVAIKCFPNTSLRNGFDEKIRQEQQFLASLNHPNIVRILDGGLTTSGIPFIIMDFVEGQPIDEFFQETPKNVKEKLQVFISICETIQFAHNHLILHLDIKPSNILITKDKAVKLLDFGISKKIGSMDSEERNVAASPFYAAPEQLQKRKISVSTDVYQLGLLLHVILTGDLPFDRKEAVSAPRKLKLDTDIINKELLAIISKCLEDNSEERYLSVNELRLDIRKHLDGIPVNVYSESKVYYFKKYIIRNKLSVSLLALLFICLSVGIIISARQTMLAEEQAKSAKIAAVKSERISEFLISLFESANPELRGNNKVEVEQLLKESYNQIRRYPNDQVKSDLLYVLGTTFSKSGQYALADSLLSQAIILNKELQLSAGENNFRAYIELSKARLYNSKLQASLETINEGIDLARILIPENEKMARLLDLQYALATMEAGKPLKADSVISRSWLTDISEVLSPLEIAEAYNTKASIKHYQEQIDSSIAYLQKSLDQLNDSLSDVHAFYLTLNENLASAYRERGDFNKALLIQKKNIQKIEAIYGRSHISYIKSANSLGLTYKSVDSLEQAHFYLSEAMDLSEQVLGRSSLAYISSAGNLSLVLSQLNRPVAAEIYAYQANESAAKFAGSEHPFYLWSLGVYAKALAENNKPEKAENMYRTALSHQAEYMGAEHPWTQKSADELSLLLVQTGQIKEADSIKALF